MNRSIIYFICSFVLVLNTNIHGCGQTKKEIKGYNKAVKTATIEGFEAFLKKFPQSVYAANANHMIDSMRYATLDRADIVSCLEFINTYPKTSYKEVIESQIFRMALEQRYIQDNSLNHYVLLENFKDFEFLGNPYYYFTYVNYKSGNSDSSPVGRVCEYVVNLLDKRSGVTHSSMFSGKVIAAEGGKYVLEGDFMDEGASGSYVVQEALFLLNELKKSDFLLPISEGDVITDQAIEWWFKNNPANARRLKFGLVPEESSIVSAFNSQKEKESSGGYKVSLFDIRGYTIIAAYQKSSNQYMLVWAEPICKDTKKDPFLNTIYFENANSLVLYYYKGRTTYKIRINMANKTIVR